MMGLLFTNRSESISYAPLCGEKIGEGINKKRMANWPSFFNDVEF